MPLEKVYSVREVAELLSVHVNTIYKYAKDGSLKAHRMGKNTLRFKETDINAFLGGNNAGHNERPDLSAPLDDRASERPTQ